MLLKGLECPVSKLVNSDTRPQSSSSSSSTCPRLTTHRRVVGVERGGAAAEGDHQRADGGDDHAGDLPGDRKPPFLAVKRPARPCKRAIKNRFPLGNAKGA